MSAPAIPTLAQAIAGVPCVQVASTIKPRAVRLLSGPERADGPKRSSRVSKFEGCPTPAVRRLILDELAGGPKSFQALRKFLGISHNELHASLDAMRAAGEIHARNRIGFVLGTAEEGAKVVPPKKAAASPAPVIDSAKFAVDDRGVVFIECGPQAVHLEPKDAARLEAFLAQTRGCRGA